jgi:hypothetical protein
MREGWGGSNRIEDPTEIPFSDEDFAGPETEATADLPYWLDLEDLDYVFPLQLQTDEERVLESES